MFTICSGSVPIFHGWTRYQLPEILHPKSSVSQVSRQATWRWAKAWLRLHQSHQALAFPSYPWRDQQKPHVSNVQKNRGSYRITIDVPCLTIIVYNFIKKHIIWSWIMIYNHFSNLKYFIIMIIDYNMINGNNVNKYKKYLCISDMMITITVTFSQKWFWTNKQTTIVGTSNVRKDRNVNYQFITISAGSPVPFYPMWGPYTYLCCKTNMAYTNLWNWLKYIKMGVWELFFGIEFANEYIVKTIERTIYGMGLPIVLGILYCWVCPVSIMEIHE